MSKAASQYLREVKKRIPCSGSQKTEFLCQLEADVIYYCEDHDDVDFAALTKCFGSPEEVASDFFAELGANVVNRENFTRQRITYITLALVMALTVLIAGIKIYSSYKQHQALDGYYIESITYEGELTPGATSPAYWSEDFSSTESLTENTK